MTDYTLVMLADPTGTPSVQWDKQLDASDSVSKGNPSAFTRSSFHNVSTQTVYTLFVKLDYPSDGEVRVPIQLSGTAVEGEDYILNDTEAVFAPGTSQTTITVTLLWTTGHIQPERIIGLTLADPIAGEAQVGYDNFWEMHVRWVGLPNPRIWWLDGDGSYSKNGGNINLVVGFEDPSQDNGYVYVHNTGGTAIEGVHFDFLEKKIPFGPNSVILVVQIVIYPGAISQDVTFIPDFHFVYHPRALNGSGLPRRNLGNFTETFGQQEHTTNRWSRFPWAADEPTGWIYGGDHAVGGSPSLEGRLDAIPNPLGELESWFVFSSRASISPGKVGHGSLLRSFNSGICGDLSASGYGYPGEMKKLQTRSAYWRQNTNADERSQYFELGIYDRTMPGGGEWHGVEMHWPDADIHTAPILQAAKRLDTYKSGWRVYTTDPLCEPVVANGWHRVEFWYESVPAHSESWIEEWAASTFYSAGDWVFPKTNPDQTLAYQAIVSGTSGGTEPTWPIIDLNTVVDGGVTWKCHKVDSDHITNRGSSGFTTSSEGTPTSLRGRGHYIWGDQVEIGITTGTAYQRVPRQYYWYDAVTRIDSVAPVITILNS